LPFSAAANRQNADSFIETLLYSFYPQLVGCRMALHPLSGTELKGRLCFDGFDTPVKTKSDLSFHATSVISPLLPYWVCPCARPALLTHKHTAARTDSPTRNFTHAHMHRTHHTRRWLAAPATSALMCGAVAARSLLHTRLYSMRWQCHHTRAWR
jgi:hypothetical protein